MKDCCILCANGNDLPEGEMCQGCGRKGFSPWEKPAMTLLQDAEWRSILIGGNHLANYLIEHLGAGFTERYPPTMEANEARASIADPEAFDVWCGWSAIMLARGWPAPNAQMPLP